MRGTRGLAFVMVSISCVGLEEPLVVRVGGSSVNTSILLAGYALSD